MHPYLRLEILARPVGGSDAAAGPWSAPLLRRVVGKALVETHCPFGEPHCQPPSHQKGPSPPASELCRLAEHCPYGVIFTADGNTRPPLALYTPAPGRSDAEARLELTLFGEAWRHYPWLLGAVARGLATGVGKERRAWRLLRVVRRRPDRSREELCGGDLTGLCPTLDPDRLDLRLKPEPTPAPVAVRLLSATRLVHAKRLLPRGVPLPFEALVARILDRFQGLFGDGASELLRPEVRSELEAEAARVPLLADETAWAEVKDYSARSDREIDLGGRVGRLVYGPEAAPFLPILKAGEAMQVGKNPAAGCGRMEVDREPAAASG